MQQKELEEYLGTRMEMRLKKYKHIWYRGTLEKFSRKSGGYYYGIRDTGPFVNAEEIEDIRKVGNKK